MTKWSTDPEVPVAPEVEGTHTLPARYYTDPGVLDREREQIHARTWQYAGDVDRVAEPGDFFTREIAGNSIIVTRDRDGELRAFYNVCAHRGSKILEGEGSERLFQCPYHGWTFELDGTLNSAPNFDEELPCEEHSLHPVAVETWSPFVFVNLAPDPDPLPETLGELPEILSGYNIDTFERVRTTHHEIDCNWKVYCDNYLECDHCPVAHQSFTQSIDLPDYEIETYGNFVLQRGTIDEDSGGYSGVSEYVDDEELGTYYAAWVWPNFTVDMTPGGLATTHVTAVDHETTVLVHDHFAREGEVDDEWEREFEMGQQVLAEDVELCERQQAGLASDAFSQGRLGPNENGVHRFQSLVQERLDV